MQPVGLLPVPGVERREFWLLSRLLRNRLQRLFTCLYVSCRDILLLYTQREGFARRSLPDFAGPSVLAQAHSGCSRATEFASLRLGSSVSPLSCENSRLQGDGLACTSQEPMYLFHAFTWAITFFAGTFGLGQSLKTIEVFLIKKMHPLLHCLMMSWCLWQAKACLILAPCMHCT